MKWITRERARVDRIACPWLISALRRSQAGVPVRAGGRGDGTRRARAGDPLRRARRGAGPPWAARARSTPSSTGTSSTIPRWPRWPPIVRGADTDDRALTPESAGLYAAATGFQAISRDDFDNMARQFPDVRRAATTSAGCGPRRPPNAPASAVRVPARRGEERRRARRTSAGSPARAVSRSTRRRPGRSRIRSWRRGP